MYPFFSFPIRFHVWKEGKLGIKTQTRFSSLSLIPFFRKGGERNEYEVCMKGKKSWWFAGCLLFSPSAGLVKLTALKRQNGIRGRGGGGKKRSKQQTRFDHGSNLLTSCTFFLPLSHIWYPIHRLLKIFYFLCDTQCPKNLGESCKKEAASEWKKREGITEVAEDVLLLVPSFIFGNKSRTRNMRKSKRRVLTVYINSCWS